MEIEPSLGDVNQWMNAAHQERSNPSGHLVSYQGDDFLAAANDAYLSETKEDDDSDLTDQLSILKKRRPGQPEQGESFLTQEEDEDGFFFKENDVGDQLDRRLQEILSSVKETGPLYNSLGSVINDDSEEDDLNLPLPSNIYANPQFERQERLDVKKPGPWFNVNNYAFQSNSENQEGNVWRRSELPITFDGDLISYLARNEPTHRDFRKNRFSMTDSEEVHRFDAKKLIQLLNAEQLDQDESTNYRNNEKSNLPNSQPSPSQSKSTSLPQNAEKLLDQESTDVQVASNKFPTRDNNNLASPSEDLNQFEIIDASRLYITIKGRFQTWKEGENLVKILSELFQVPRSTFSDLNVEENRVTFRVLPNSKGLTSSLVAARTDEMRDKIRLLSGFQVDGTGIGDQSNVSSVVYWGQEKQQMLLTVALCVLVAAILAAAVALFLLRRRYQARQKLKGLTQSADSEATRDYQDLCRARMATKSPAPAAESNKDASKMPHTIMSRDSESSRSSTSSWCEEPVVSNMDISTGHMVLSYMEDHLRNKDRLDQEWQALCAYEAEPSTSTSVASKPENENKNRCPDVLPYDHSRVVLNALANVNGSDYINASAIADHDPRHPAYIAAQAPVSDTAADFWQMVWEQGSVVLVLLTRLSENGQQLCHRYWPEEGSQLYHIYEVHLVSEHIWCDDYLVRSFYLKNIRTGETRTVTQFHFLSWPENGVPLSTKALLEFRRKVNKSYRGRSCPIVVHCSDGAGRTGTYCLIDMVLHRMAKGAREIDIAATLEHLRDQRPQAVRTKQQFEFVLTAVAEEVHAILRALPQ
nr:EOG090X01LO [Cyclestheria hislopi]